MIVCPKLLPTILLYAARQKCRIGPLAGAPPTRVRWSSALRLNRDSSLKMTRLSLSNARSANPVDTAYDVGSVVASMLSVSFSLDGTGCLEGDLIGRGIKISGYVRKLKPSVIESWARNLVLMKTHHVKGLMEVKSVETQSSTFAML
ncbi:hypothetical protein TNCV_1405031 [Trichonephila clavipes]|nr:hypothetical protein TNCV_1405031 [Trichonephila clavipes]